MTLSTGYLILAAGSLLLLAFLSWSTYQSGKILQANPPDTNLLLSTPENVARFVLIGLCIGLGLASDLDLTRLGWTLADPWGSLFRGAILGVAVQIPLGWLTRLAVRRLGATRDIYSPVVVRLILPKTRRQAVLVALAFLPAVFMEEMLFRSLLLGGFSVLFNPWILGLVWAVVFGTMHLPQGSVGTIATSFIGFILAGAFIVSGGLLVPVAAHYVMNILQVWDADRHRDWLKSLP
jgi:membrane protease YdiL (CAAX protease family)